MGLSTATLTAAAVAGAGAGLRAGVRRAVERERVGHLQPSWGKGRMGNHVRGGRHCSGEMERCKGERGQHLGAHVELLHASKGDETTGAEDGDENKETNACKQGAWCDGGTLVAVLSGTAHTQANTARARCVGVKGEFVANNHNDHHTSPS